MTLLPEASCPPPGVTPQASAQLDVTKAAQAAVPQTKPLGVHSHGPLPAKTLATLLTLSLMSANLLLLCPPTPPARGGGCPSLRWPEVRSQPCSPRETQGQLLPFRLKLPSPRLPQSPPLGPRDPSLTPHLVSSSCAQLPGLARALGTSTLHTHSSFLLFPPGRPTQRSSTRWGSCAGKV